MDGGVPAFDVRRWHRQFAVAQLQDVLRDLQNPEPGPEEVWASLYGQARGNVAGDPTGLEAVFGAVGAGAAGPPPPPGLTDDLKAQFLFLLYCQGCPAFEEAKAAAESMCAGSGCKTEITNCRYDPDANLKCLCDRTCVPDGEGADNGCTGSPVPFGSGPCSVIPDIDWSAAAQAAIDELNEAGGDQWEGLMNALSGGGGASWSSSAGCEQRYPRYPKCSDKQRGSNYYSSLDAAKRYMREAWGRDVSFSKDKFKPGMTYCEGSDQPEHWSVYHKDDPKNVLDTIVCCQCCQGARAESGPYLQTYCRIAYDD